MTWHSDKYEAWIRTQDCVANLVGCTVDKDITVHHIKGIGMLSGAGMKAPSWAAFSLCPNCHSIIQQAAKDESWLLFLQWECVCRTLGKAIEKGILVLK